MPGGSWAIGTATRSTSRHVCIDRNVERGLGDKLALVHENHEGEIRQFTYRDLKQLTNGWAAFLRGLGIKPLERVCLFLDRIPELYIGFMGILKTGAIVEPLFSAFGEDALISQDGGQRRRPPSSPRASHLGKVRKVRERLPNLEHVIVVDHEEDGKPLKDGEVAFSEMATAVDAFAFFRPSREPERPPLHERHDRQAEGRDARPLAASSRST